MTTMMLLLSVSALVVCSGCIFFVTYGPSTVKLGDTATLLNLRRLLAGTDPRWNRRLHYNDNDDDDDDDDDDEDKDDEDKDDDESRDLPVVGLITGLRLINSNIDIPIRSITNGSQYNVYNYPTLNLNMHIDTNGTVGSVLLQYSNMVTTKVITRTTFSTFTYFFYNRTDVTTPFSLCGDTNTTIIASTVSSPSRNTTMNIIYYDTCSFLSTEGQHTITVLPYLYPNATGRSGTPYTVTFNVLNRNTNVRLCKVPKVCYHRKNESCNRYVETTLLTHNTNCWFVAFVCISCCDTELRSTVF